MARLLLAIDTEENTLEASVDGVALANVDGCSVYNCGSSKKPEYTFSITSFEVRDGVRYTSQVSASDLLKGVAARKDKDPDVVAELAKYLSSRRDAK